MIENTLAIDQSLISSGWYSKGGYGVILSKEKGIDRLIDIRKKVTDLIKKEAINTLIIEDYSFASRGRGVFNLGELGGMLRLLAHDLKIKLVVVNTSLLKKFITGRGNAPKEVMLVHVYSKFGFMTEDNNIADAFSLYTFYTEYSKWKNGLSYPASKTEIFKKFEHPKEGIKRIYDW